MSNPTLIRLFEELKEKCFEGRLPEYRLELLKPQTNQDLDGENLWPELRININPRLRSNEAELRKVMIHEMCHHECVGHTEEFIAKLRSVEAMGEPLAGKDAEELEKAEDDVDHAKMCLTEYLEAIFGPGVSLPTMEQLYEYVAFKQNRPVQEIVEIQAMIEAITSIHREYQRAYASPS